MPPRARRRAVRSGRRSRLLRLFGRVRDRLTALRDVLADAGDRVAAGERGGQDQQGGGNRAIHSHSPKSMRTLLGRPAYRNRNPPARARGGRVPIIRTRRIARCKAIVKRVSLARGGVAHRFPIPPSSIRAHFPLDFGCRRPIIRIAYISESPADR
nr:hypothetical protein DO63_5967 [Burkholderia pseudomallei]